MVEDFIEDGGFGFLDVNMHFGCPLVEEDYRCIENYSYPFFKVDNSVDAAQGEFMEWGVGGEGFDYKVAEVVDVYVVNSHEIFKKDGNVKAIGRFGPFAEHFI